MCFLRFEYSFSIVINLVCSRSRALKARLRESFILSEDKTALLPSISFNINGAGARCSFLHLFTPELCTGRFANANVCWFALLERIAGCVLAGAWIHVNFRLGFRAHSGHTLNPFAESDRILCVVARTGQVGDLLLFAPQVLPLLLANTDRATCLGSQLGCIGLVLTRARIIIPYLRKLTVLDYNAALHALTKLFLDGIVTGTRVLHSHLDLILPYIGSPDIADFAIG